METKGIIKISPKYGKSDYHKLKLSLNSDESSWKAAIDIFKDRIQGRYLNQIDLLSCDINANGFAIMAINCLLIETLYQFENGLEKTEERKNKEKYTDFLKKMDSVSFDSDTKAESFYFNIRCGILHSAQTKRGARLSDEEGFVVKTENGVLIVSVKGVTDLLKKYFNKYTKKLLDANETELRKNFIEKMKYVCRK